MKLAIIGATGLVGQEIMHVMGERGWNSVQLLPVASTASTGKNVTFSERNYTVMGLEEALSAKPTLAIFSAGKTISKQWAPRFVAAGTTVIDNSSAWRLHTNCPLVVPEVNGHLCTGSQARIIANPNCSTIQLVTALNPLHKACGIAHVSVATYQAVSGCGQKAVQQLLQERVDRIHQQTLVQPATYVEKEVAPEVPPYDLNVIPYIDDCTDSGYTKEEMKIIQETPKILNDTRIAITATAVRVPVVRGHSLAVNVTLRKDFTLSEIVQLLHQSPGIRVCETPTHPMPVHVQHSDEVWVGRLRKDISKPCSLEMWIVADNLRKGAATNAVQIAEYFFSQRSAKASI